MADLKEYISKRSFSSTTEPGGVNTKTGKKLEYVIQKHDASHLHYDFRLEHSGVLLSWAVPKGPSMNPDDKHLAMRTEDHPFDYRKFEGIIPEGNYGAGNVIIWDKGTYEVVNGGKTKEDQERSLEEDLKNGKLSVILDGQKLRGEFSLIKSFSKEKNAWLLIKKKDKEASDKDITARAESVVSGRDVADINDKKFNWKDRRDLIKKYDLKKRKIKHPVKPMLASLADKPFSDKDWLYEIKWDGYRAIAEVSPGGTRLYSRGNQSFNSKYPDIAGELATGANDIIVDGEIVMLDSDGKPNFNKLQNYNPQKDSSPVYYVFDLLWLEGYDLTEMPLVVRKQFLQEVLPISSLVRFSDHLEENGEKLFKMAAYQNLEGVMAKKSRSNYQIGKRSKSWLKLKTGHRQEMVIGGFTEPQGGRKGLGSLLVGVYDGDDLVYAGRAGTGLSDKELVDIRKMLGKIERKTSPFKGGPRDSKSIHWVSPKQIVEVAFSEWTPEKRMRHPKIIGLRSDKRAQEVVREVPVSSTLNIDITNKDKIFWPKLGLSKGNLIEYYRDVSRYMMPYIKDKPMTLLRHPNGITGNSFFQKDNGQSLPENIESYTQYSESNKKEVNYLVSNNEEALLYMVQLGCIEINPWNSTVKNIDHPDWLVLDLDPESTKFDTVIETALTIKDLLDELEIKSFIKTSGKTGMHIYLPLKAKYSYEQVKNFAEILARNTVRKLPRISSVERSPSKRQRKVYIDYLQNRMGQTVAAPYSVRPVETANVSMPLDWHEVKKGLLPSDYTLTNALKIIKDRRDPWEDFFKTATNIERAISIMEKLKT